MRMLIVVTALLLPFGADARAPKRGDYRALFAGMDRALKDKSEAKFKALWHPKGYDKNLVGSSGLTGAAVYRQGSRKGWFLKADVRGLIPLPRRRGGPWIVKCDVWSRKKQRAVDSVYAFPVYDDKTRLVMLGAGEKLEQVLALAQRWVKKQPLAPKKRR